MRSRHLSTVIHCSPETVYAFAANPENLTAWAAGLVQSKVTRDGELLVVDSPEGRTTIRFVERNDLGVLDHDVTLPSGATTNNPFRVLAHPEGAEVLFTLRQFDLSDSEFDRDAAMVDADLRRLKELLESRMS
jgi:hypothetical protein